MIYRPYLRPLSFLYSQVVTLKNSLYDRALLPQQKVSCPVISVGNLTMGGTGKTPFVDFILKLLEQKGQRIAVVSRSYRAEVQEPHQVDEQISRAAFYFGDEPVQLAWAHPKVDFYVGPRKWQTARFAVSQKSYDLLIIDDGFQHRRLHRDLDIVVLDATEAIENYALLPEGRARESWAQLNRANLIVITKCNWVSEQKLNSLTDLVPTDKKLILTDYQQTSLKWVFEKKEIPWSEVKNKTVFLVSAIARPEIFEKQISEKITVLGVRHFRDHHPYSEKDAESLLHEFVKSKADLLLTTEKDAVKLRSLMPQETPLVVTPLKVTERNSQGAIDEVLSSMVR